MSNPSPRYRVGYALSPKKEKTFIQDSLIAHAKQQGVELIRIDPTKPLAQQGPFDCVVHKLYDHDWTHRLRQLLLQQPDVVVIDPPEAVERLHNRVSMLEVVTQLGNETFGVPNQRVVYDSETLRGPSAIRELGLRLPVIAKAVEADGGTRSHEMCLVLSPKGLSKLETPIVVQEFVNHGGVLFKVYVVGEYVKCVKRSSLPDVPEEKLNDDTTDGILSFSQISNSASVEDEGWCTGSAVEKPEMPSFESVVELARGLREAMGLRLFNFDLIRDARGGNGRCLVIDINYFPGYAKMPSYESVMVDFFQRVVDEKRNKTGGLEEEHQQVIDGGSR